MDLESEINFKQHIVNIVIMFDKDTWLCVSFFEISQYNNYIVI